jgi:hypothetical protein
VSWPELLGGQSEKAAEFFNDLHSKFTALREHIAAINYALPAML